MRSELLERIGPDQFTPEPGRIEGEDWAFCRKAKQIGALLAVGTAMPSIHVDPRDGTGYLPGMPAMMMDGNGVRTMTVDHLNGAGQVKTGEMRTYGLSEAESAFAKAASETRAALSRELEQRRGLLDNAMRAGAVS